MKMRKHNYSCFKGMLSNDIIDEEGYSREVFDM